MKDIPKRFEFVTLTSSQITAIRLMNCVALAKIESYGDIDKYEGDGSAMFEFQTNGFLRYDTKELKKIDIL